MNPDDIRFELNSLFEEQRSAYSREPFPAWEVRAERLRKLKSILVEHGDEIAAAIDSDFGGRPHFETRLAEIFPCLEEIKSALRHGRGWMKPRRAPVGKWFLPATASVLPQPLGVVGIIVPWNYPLVLAVGPLVAALAAGNRALIKMSEFTPEFSALFARLMADRFPASEIAVVNGGPEMAAAFSQLPFDHLLFTGSTLVGRKVMAAAAANLTPVTLELGGKSPAVIAPGYPLAKAVERILVGKLLNAGQTCIAPDYVLVPRAQVDAFVQQARATAARFYPEGLASPEYCSVVNPRQYARLTGYLSALEGSGARVEPLFAGAARQDEAHRLAPVLVLDPPLGSAVMSEEIFGPLLPVIAYDDADEAIAFINARPRPLALYWFDHQAARVEAMLRSTHAGGVTVNDTLLHMPQDGLPFGGVGPAGMGHYHGRWGFETFSKMKPVFHQAGLNGMSLFNPPYSDFARRMLGWMQKF
ncbi:MAG: coniferyl aldehyde dehydrogenase [Burkholderiaceae bacterium]